MKRKRLKVWKETTSGGWIKHRLPYPTLCFYCGSPENLTWDHKVPRSRGGSNHRTNLVRCCYPCNQRKGAKTVEEFMSAQYGIQVYTFDSGDGPVDVCSDDNGNYLCVYSTKKEAQEALKIIKKTDDNVVSGIIYPMKKS